MKVNFLSLLKIGLFAGLISAAVNALIFFIFHALGVFTDDIQVQPNQPLNAIAVIMSSVLPSLLGSVVLYLFLRFTKNGMRIFTIVSLILVVISFMNPFTMIPNVTISYGVVLDVMHIVVAGVLLFMQKRMLEKE